MTLVFHTLLCLLILTLVHITPQFLSAIFPNALNWSSGASYIFMIIIHLASIVYFYVSKRYSVFALPLSHIVFPFIFYCAMLFLWKYSSLWKAFETPWESFVILVIFFYLLPIAVITFVISLIIKRKQ